MDKEDQEELLQCTDEESGSETEEQCLPPDKPEDEEPQANIAYFSHSKLEFIVTKFTLILSSFILLVLLPLYLNSVNISGNAYSLILTTTVASCVGFIGILIVAKYFCKKCGYIKILSSPVRLYKLLLFTLLYFLCGLLIIYSSDRKRVLCHLQDPIKGVVLVFSMLYYFFCCRKFMGLRRIFSATTVIVGLFIAVDYGLCDEYTCRGYERQRITDDTGIWSWQTHGAWTTLYIFGLALFAASFTFLERCFLENNDTDFQSLETPSTFLSTVSRTVSFPTTNNGVYVSQLIGNRQPAGGARLTKRISVVHLAMWIHVIGTIIAIALFWTDFTPVIGKGSSAMDSWNYTKSGISCHFVTSRVNSNCGNVAIFSWIFIITYMVFIVTAIRFLILTQSAVYTVATMTSSVALVGIWWSLFYASPGKNGTLVWFPRVTGELVCSLLGTPIIGIGLYFLGKAHFLDYSWFRRTSVQIAANYQTT